MGCESCEQCRADERGATTATSHSELLQGEGERDGRCGGRCPVEVPAPPWSQRPRAAVQAAIAYGGSLRIAVICRPLRVNQPVTSPRAVDGISDTWTARGRCSWAGRADWRGRQRALLALL